VRRRGQLRGRGRLRRVRLGMSDRDRFGLGWRAPLAAELLPHLDRVDVVEVVAEDLFHASRARRRAIRSLAREVPLHLHGVSLGAASTVPVGRERLDRWARLVGEVEPEAWSEHLAFVRGGGVEIGGLAAPPRTGPTVAGTARNLARAARVVGSRPLVENVATLIDPPLSDRDEPSFVREVLSASGCGLLLDLHNLHANATNFAWDPISLLDAVPADRLGVVHLAGGSFVGRVLDDHLHPVPAAVFSLLSEVARRAPGPLTVILERDGAFEGIAPLLAELDAARAAVAAGRAHRVLS
jgi:uncharacterized protein